MNRVLFKKRINSKDIEQVREAYTQIKLKRFYKDITRDLKELKNREDILYNSEKIIESTIDVCIMIIAERYKNERNKK